MMLFPPEPQQGWVGGDGGVGCLQHVAGGLGVQPHPPAMAAMGALSASKVRPAARVQRHSKRLFMIGIHGHSRLPALRTGPVSLA